MRRNGERYWQVNESRLRGREGIGMGDIGVSRRKRFRDVLRSSFTAAATLSYQWLGHRMQNITSDKGVLKEIIRDGSGETVPPDSSVLVKFSGYLEHTDRPFDTNWFKKNPKLMKLGEDITLRGLEIGLLTMRKGELARFLFKPNYAFGTLGCPPLIPPNSTVLFEVELLDFLDSAESDRFFDLPPASSVLNRICAKETEKEKVDAARLLVFLNLSFVCLKLERPDRALAYGIKALELDEKNAKALFRCGQACLYLTEYERAREFLVKAQKEQPFNQDINNELKKLAR
ncbi:hypothetical protein E2320_018280 [Naja naja]|nr:hypothetical protein E2320_018280 [Naja naja]